MRLKIPHSGWGKIERATLLASALAGAWRRSPPPLQTSPSILASLAPLLVRSNAAGLGWRRLRHSGLRNTPAARELRRIGQVFALDNVRQENHIEQVVARLRDAGIEPILIKGWASARHYADPGSRPYGDIDLCVPPDRLVDAMPAIHGAIGSRGLVDLHRGVPDLPDRSWETIEHHSRLVRLGGSEVRVLGAEDELRLLCLHLIRHSGWRPLWLCDVAAAREDRPADFDDNYFLSGDARLSAWVRCVLALASELLDARSEQPFVAELVPSWLPRTILWHWGTAGETPPLADHFRQPGEVVQTLLYDWLNPIKALFRLRLNPCRWRWSWLMPPVAVVGRLALGGARFQRLVRKTLHPVPARPFDLHREEVM